MRALRSIAVFVALACGLVASLAPARADDGSPLAFLQSVYRVYEKSDTALDIATEAAAARYFVPSLAHLIAEDIAESQKRDPKSISISVFWAPPDRGAIDGYAKLGVERVIFALPSESRETVLPMLDGYARLIQ